MSNHITSMIYDDNALRYNYAIAKKLAPNSKVMAMIKANAYGHGLRRTAQILSKEGADSFGVSCFNEAFMLRHWNIQLPISVMHGFYNKDELIKISELSLCVAIHASWQIEMLEKVLLPKPISLWIRVDIDNGYLGFSLDELDSIYHRLKYSKNVSEIKILTHLINPGNADDVATEDKISLFNKVTSRFECIKSVAASQGLLNFPKSHFDCVRPGTMLYGISPIFGCSGNKFGLKPVMALTSQLIAIRLFKKGENIGYGDTWICPEDMLVGIVPVGYGDGYPRHAINSTPILINDRLCQLIGSVSMDLLAVDLMNCPQAKIGDSVLLWGGKLAIERISTKASTIPPELTCRLTARVFGYE
jgi:alanine racemase